MVRTAPSVRKKPASSRRAPLPWRSIAATSIRASAASEAAMLSAVAIGSAKRFSTMKSGGGLRGEIGASRKPSAWPSSAVNASPNRAVIS